MSGSTGGTSAGEAVWSIKGDLSELEAALNDGTEKVKKTTAGLTESLSTVGKGMTAIGAGMVAPLALGVKAATDFGSAIASIASLGTENMGELEATIRKTAVAYGLDLTEAAQGTYDAISSGADAFTAPKILEDAARAAAAGQTDLATSIQFGMGMANAFGVELSDLGGVFDTAFIGVNKGVMTFEELSSAAGRSAPAFAANNLSMDEMVGAAAALTLGNVKASEAFTQLNAVVAGFTRQGESSKLETMGLQGALQWLQEQTGGNKTEMLEFLGSTEALSAAMALTGNQSGAFTEIMGQMGDKVGATKEAFDIIAASDPAFAWKQLQATMQDLAITIGQAILPVLGQIVETVKPWLESAAEWMKANEGLTQTILLVGGAVGVFMVTLGPLFMMLPGLIAFFGALGTIAGAAGLVLSGPVVAGIAAVIAAGALIFAFWDKIKAAASALWDGVTSVFSAGAEVISGVWEGIVAAATWVGEGLAGAFGWIGETAKSIFTGLADFFGGIWDGIVGIFQSAWDTIAGIVGWVLDAVGSVVGAAANLIGLGGGGPVGAPTVPGFAEGGTLPDGMSIVGERGPEAIIKQGTHARVISASNTSAAMGGITINMGGVTVANDYDVDRLAQRLGNQLRSKLNGVGIQTARATV